MKGSRFWIGVTLIVVSFALYPAYALIAFLPLSNEAKAACVIAGWVFSWSLFFVGSTLAGKEGVEYVKSMLRRRVPPP